MAVDNLISIEISPEQKRNIEELINKLKESFKPYLVTLDPDLRRELPKMGDKTFPFVNKIMDYAESNPEFAPAYADIAEFKKDVKAVEELTLHYRALSHLVEGLNDAIMLAGSEAYVAALAYYNSVKQASKMDISAAELIYADLNKRFPSRKKGTQE